MHRVSPNGETPGMSSKVFVPRGQVFVPKTPDISKVFVPKDQVFIPRIQIVDEVLVPEGEVFVPRPLEIKKRKTHIEMPNMGTLEISNIQEEFKTSTKTQKLCNRS